MSVDLKAQEQFLKFLLQDVSEENAAKAKEVITSYFATINVGEFNKEVSPKKLLSELEPLLLKGRKEEVEQEIIDFQDKFE